MERSSRLLDVHFATGFARGEVVFVCVHFATVFARGEVVFVEIVDVISAKHASPLLAPLSFAHWQVSLQA